MGAANKYKSRDTIKNTHWSRQFLTYHLEESRVSPAESHMATTDRKTASVTQLQIRIKQEFGKQYKDEQCDKLATELTKYLEYHLV